jgi:hypothetical protein
MSRATVAVGRPVKFTLISSFVVFGLYLVFMLVASDFRGPESISVLSSEFAAIAPPPKSRQSGEVRRTSRLIIQTVAADFESELSGREIEAHYDDALRRNGWRLLAARETTGNDWSERSYCKNGFDAILQATQMGDAVSRYYFAVRWEGGPYTRTGC